MAETRALEIKTLRRGLVLSQESLSRLLDVGARSVERWEAKGARSASGGTQWRLPLLMEIVGLARETYGDGVAVFMAMPRRSLGMRTARESLIHGDLDAVRELLVNELESHWGQRPMRLAKSKALTGCSCRQWRSWTSTGGTTSSPAARHRSGRGLRRAGLRAGHHPRDRWGLTRRRRLGFIIACPPRTRSVP